MEEGWECEQWPSLKPSQRPTEEGGGGRNLGTESTCHPEGTHLLKTQAGQTPGAPMQRARAPEAMGLDLNLGPTSHWVGLVRAGS